MNVYNDPIPRLSLQDLTEDILNPQLFSIECKDYDWEEDKWVTCMINYRAQGDDISNKVFMFFLYIKFFYYIFLKILCL